MEQERAQLEPLREAYRKAADPDEALKLERKIGEIKSRTEEAVLQIQLKYARAEGKSDRVEALENLLIQRAAPAMAKSGEAPVRRHQEEEQR